MISQKTYERQSAVHLIAGALVLLAIVILCFAAFLGSSERSSIELEPRANRSEELSPVGAGVHSPAANGPESPNPARAPSAPESTAESPVPSRPSNAAEAISGAKHPIQREIERMDYLYERLNEVSDGNLKITYASALLSSAIAIILDNQGRRLDGDPHTGARSSGHSVMVNGSHYVFAEGEFPAWDNLRRLKDEAGGEYVEVEIPETLLRDIFNRYEESIAWLQHKLETKGE